MNNKEDITFDLMTEEQMYKHLRKLVLNINNEYNNEKYKTLEECPTYEELNEIVEYYNVLANFNNEMTTNKKVNLIKVEDFILM